MATQALARKDAKPRTSMPHGAFWLALALSLSYVALMVLTMWLFEKAVVMTSVDGVRGEAGELSQWVLIGATAIAIFFITYRLLSRIESATEAMSSAPHATAAPGLGRHVWPLLLSVGALFVATGAYVFWLQEGNLNRALYRYLTMIATQKAQVASSWVEERRRDLRVLLENEAFMHDVEALLASPTRAARTGPVSADLNAVIKANGFRGIALLDTRGGLVLTLPDTFEPHPDCTRLARDGPDPAGASATALTLAFARAAEEPMLDVVTHLTARAQPGSRHLATLCVRVNLAQLLLPAVSLWPVKSHPGEVLFGRIDGEDAVLLNASAESGKPWTMARRPGEAVYWRQALEATRKGALSERMRAGAPAMLRAAYEVTGTPWIVMVRMDAHAAGQMQSRLERRVTIVIGFLILFLVTAGTVMSARNRALNVAHAREREALLAELSDMALRDELTGLPRRHVVEDRLNVALARAAREHTGVGLLYIDFNGFKAINDLHGHAAGDAVLAACAARMSQALRESDTVGRVGGDEFMFVLPFDRETVDPEIVRDKLAKQISEPIEWQGQTLRVGASIGWAAFPADGRTAGELIAQADQRMYEQKGARKGPSPGR